MLYPTIEKDGSIKEIECEEQYTHFISSAPLGRSISYTDYLNVKEREVLKKHRVFYSLNKNKIVVIEVFAHESLDKEVFIKNFITEHVFWFASYGKRVNNG